MTFPTMWLRAGMTCFREQVPERFLVLALGVLKILSASVCHCSIVVGSVSVCSVSVSFCVSVFGPLGVCACLCAFGSVSDWVRFVHVNLFESCLSLSLYCLCSAICVFWLFLFLFCSRPFAAVPLECEPLREGLHIVLCIAMLLVVFGPLVLLVHMVVYLDWA